MSSFQDALQACDERFAAAIGMRPGDSDPDGEWVNTGGLLRGALSDLAGSPEALREIVEHFAGMARHVHELHHDDGTPCDMLINTLLIAIADAYVVGRLHERADHPGPYSHQNG